MKNRRTIRKIEAMEDLALVHIIKKGKEAETIDKQEVFSTLEGSA